MKVKLAHKLFTAVVVSSLFTFSIAMADQTRWLNPQKFIGEPNVNVSHASSFMYPGSIIVDIIPEVIEPPVDPPVNEEAEIIKQFKLNERYTLSGITVCFRDYATALPFAINIYKKGAPVVDQVTGVTTVGEDETLASVDQFIQPAQECTSIDLAEEIQPTDDTLLLGITFSFGADPIAPIISAVGLDQTSLYLELDGCTADIFDFEVEAGVMLSDLVDTCAADAKNHGKFVRCVTKAAKKLKKYGIITGKEKGRITKCAAKSNLP